MIKILIELLFYRGLTIKRWNNYPRVEDVTILDNCGFVIHTALFLAHLEEKNGNKVNKEFLIKRIIFSTFKKLILSDISSGTNLYIRKIDPSIGEKLEAKVFKNLLEIQGLEYITKDFEETINDTQNTLELSIIKAAKKYTSLEECNINAKVFSGIYDGALEEVQMYLSYKKHSLPSLGKLLSNPNYKTYLLQIRRLSHSKRWLGKNRQYEISVMSHLVIVSFFSYLIAMIENAHGSNYNIEDFLLRGMYHDIPEAITGDIITPTKSAIPGFREVLEQVEEKMMDDYFFLYIDKQYKETIKEYILNPFTCEKGKYVKHADIFSMLFEAKIEIQTNKTFNNIFENLKKQSECFQTASSKYILKECLDSFGTSDFNKLVI